MFTEGLDESAINWIKQGLEVEKPQLRSLLTDNYDKKYPIPRSPLGLSSTSSYVLPPLKFHSGLLGSQNPAALSLDSSEDNYGDDDEDYDENDGDSESVASVPDELDRSCPEEEELNKAIPLGSNEEMLNQKTSAMTNQIRGAGSLSVLCGPKLNRGLSKEYLRIEVPESTRRHTDTEMGFEGFEQRSVASNGGSRLQEIVQPHSAYATPLGRFSDVVDLGTPSAPPLMEIRQKGQCSEVRSPCSGNSGVISEFDKTNEGLNMPKEPAEEVPAAKEVLPKQNEQSLKLEVGEREDSSRMASGETEETTGAWEEKPKDYSPYYDASDQNAWQSLIAYDACMRLCLNAWARGCTEAPEFLRDECLLLRNAFGLHKFLLQPHGTQSADRTTKKIDRALPLKRKQIAGKIRLEVKKLRIITRRKLKSTNSLRGAMYVQVGAEYVRHVSSLVKSGINSLKLASFSLSSEESFSCLVQLKSCKEDNQDEISSAVSLQPGTGEYHDFFPEKQGDSILLEVQDTKKNVQGRAAIPVSSLTDNPIDKVRWWPIYHDDDHECIGKVQLSISWAFTNDEFTHIKNGPIVETLAYDLLLEAAMRSNKFHARNLHLDEPWKWLLTEFAEYYGISDTYTKLRYLSYVMNVAMPTKDCIELVYELLLPVMQARNDKSLTRQEKSILLNCETQVEGLLADVFQNYKSLDEKSPTGIADVSAPMLESAAPSLAPAVKVYTLLHDILTEDAKTILRNYFQTAAMRRCRKHMLETDELLSTNSEGLVMDSITMSTSYLKMKNLCFNISSEIQADLKIHNQHILPSSIDLASITATVYSTELCKWLRAFLSAWPPSSPQPYVSELLIATSDFERNLESWNIRAVLGGVDARDLYHDYIMVWIQDMQVNLLDHCKAEKVPWSGVITNYSTSPFAEEMFANLKAMLHEYEVVINRWPQYTLILENAVANIERAIIKALEKQYNDILTPLKDSVPKKLGMQVQKLARRQSTALYSAPAQLGTFLNTLNRILDVLHCKIEDILKAWASYLPLNGEKKSSFGEQMNGVTVLLRTKYKNYMQAMVVKLASNMQASRNTRLQRILEETKATDGEAEIRERMQMLTTQLSDSISNLHDVFTSRIFVAVCRGFWDKMGQIVVKFLEGRKENRAWYSGSYHALGILDDIFASQMQRLQGNALQEKDLEPPRSINEARSILCRDTTNGMESSTYLYF